MKYCRKARAAGSAFSSLPGQSKDLRKNYLSATSADELLNRHYTPTSANTNALDLGCGSNPRNPFQAPELFGADIRSDLEGNLRQADLSIEPIPFGDNMFDFCTAFNFIEHIPRNSYPRPREWCNSLGISTPA
jgi:hypothetical protein